MRQLSEAARKLFPPVKTFLRSAGRPKKEQGRRSIVVDGSLDIETTDWDQFLCIGVQTRDGYRAFDFRREKEAVDFLLGFKGVLWAHNGGRFDFNWLLDWCLELGQEVVMHMAGGRIIRAKLNNLTLCDSAALIPLPLKEACQIGKVKKLATGMECICGRDCGGYCNFGRDRARLRRVMDYMEYDCGAVLSMLDSLVEFADANDLDLCTTLGASSWATAQRRCGIESADWTDPKFSTGSLFQFCMDGAHGGRNQCFRPRADYAICDDVNSAYPYALTVQELPCGERRSVDGSKASIAYADGYEGMFEARVDVPKMFIPPLPLRTSTRIAYPTGKFIGTWTGLELREAESLGVKIEKIGRAIYWQEKKQVFGEYFTLMHQVRKKAQPDGKKTPLGNWVKLDMNAVSGKLSQRPETDTLVICPKEKPKPCNGKGACKGGCRRRCPRALDPMQRIWLKPGWRLDACAHIHWAGYLRAHARVRLARRLRSYDDGATAVYCDTDSSIRTQNPGDAGGVLGDELGQWKRSFMGLWHCLAPKTYQYVDMAGCYIAKGYGIPTGEWIAAAKGVPDAVRNFHKLGAGVLAARGVLGIRQTSREAGQLDEDGKPKGLFRKKVLHRRLQPVPNHYGDRVLKRDGRTYPVDASELPR